MLLSSPETTPDRLSALLRIAATAGPLPADRLEAFAQPTALRERGQVNAAVGANLRLALELGLLRLSEGEPPTLRLAAGPGGPWTNEALLREAGRRLLGKDLPEPDPAAPGEHYQFARLVAWLLDQPLSRPPRFADLQERWAQAAEPGFRPLDPPAFDRLLVWASALGVLHPLNVGRQQPVPLTVVNPTPFLRRHLGDFMTPGVPSPAPDWLRLLAEHFPVFDRGAIRQRVRPIGDQILTPSLSLAVRQLAGEGRLTLEDRKDAPRLRLRVGRFEQQFTHATWEAGSAA